ncbi:MAG TPA: substrate-binding domain-containing protein, partial [Candidatus Nitrosotalea sp.]|nr:substrate-binding domain-containing protein [Candidatus Nitrosotalea sp.]
MRKTLVTLALAAVPALLLSACNGSTAGGGTGVAALPNVPTASHHRMHHNDNGAQDLHAGGATFPAYAYNLASQPVGLYNSAQAPPKQGSLFYSYGGVGTIYYCLTGSGFGRKEFTGQSITATAACAGLGDTPVGFGGRQDPLDFVGTDQAMTEGTSSKPGDCCASYSYYAQHRLVGTQTWGQPFEIPVVGGPIVYGFRPQDFSAIKTMKLSTWTYCAIANGTIADWNDPAITADNGKSITGGVSESITFYFRSDSSGTSYNYTNDLNVRCNPGSWPAPYNSYPYENGSRAAEWTFGVNTVWPGPGSSADPNPRFIGENGNPGVLAGIQSTPYGTGYIEGGYAKSANPKVGQAWLQNGFSKKKHSAIFVNPMSASAVKNALAKVTASNITYGGASDGGSLNSSTPWCQLYIDPSNFTSSPAKTYPLVAVSYLLFYGNNNGVHLSDKTTLIKYMTSAAASTIMGKLEYAPLSNSIHQAILNA